MKPVFLLIVVLCIVTQVKNYPQSSINSIGTIDSIYSKILNETRKIYVYSPNRGSEGKLDSISYPVVYLLDGEHNFLTVANMIEQLGRKSNSILPKMIVVGLLNTNRTRDLTPTNVPEFDSTSGGGENFISFLDKELIPHIDSLYPTLPYRIIIGPSIGGLTVLNILIHHSNLFDSYIAIDPSLWWDDQMLLKQANNELHEKQLGNKTLFLAVANTLPLGFDTSIVKDDTTGFFEHINSIFKFIEVLKNNSANGLRLKWKYYEEDGHSSVALISEYDALRFIFSDYRMPLFEKILADTLNVDSGIDAQFKRISKQLGYMILPPETEINDLGYIFLEKKIFPKAYAFFDMNVKNYPNSLNVLDSMGDYYAVIGNKEKAIECYTKAFSINKWEETRKKIEELMLVK